MCITFHDVSDVFFAKLPAGIVQGLSYPFQFARDSRAHLTSTCGIITRNGTAGVFTATHAVAGESCPISVVGGTQDVWVTIAVDANYVFQPSQFYLLRNSTLVGSVGVALEPTTASLPPLLAVVRPSADYLFSVFANTSALPPGISLNPHSGTFSGTPTLAGSTTTPIEVLDTATGLSLYVGDVQFVIAAPPRPSSLSAAAYAVPVAVGGFLLVLALALLYWRERQRNALKPQNFEEILAALSTIDANSGERRTPREIKRPNLKLLDQLGEGNFGAVHKGLLDEIPGTPGYIVAVKSLRAGIDAERGPMLQEAALMAQFEHAHVVRLVGVVTLGDPLLVVLEYCEYGALKSYLEKTEVAGTTQCRLAADCADGMAYLAKHKFIHRDLAARNVLLSSDRQCKIADFGLSREVNNEYYRSRGGQVAVRWAAPETLDEHKYSEQSDVWSFGVLLYEIWTKGATPYGEWNNQRVWTEVLAGYRLPQPLGCPDHIFRLMQRCWLVAEFRPEFSILLRELRKLEQQTYVEVSNVAESGPRYIGNYVDLSAGAGEADFALYHDQLPRLGVDCTIIVPLTHSSHGGCQSRARATHTAPGASV